MVNKYRFTRYHFPAVGQAFTLLQLKSKYEQETHAQETGDHLRGWVACDSIHDSWDYIPEVGGMLTLTLYGLGHPAQGFKGIRVLREKHNVFRVVEEVY